MATFFVAGISPEHYDSFRRLLGRELPDSFDAWAYRQSERIAKLSAKSHAVYEVRANPDEFTRYCQATNSEINLKSLDTFASEKANGKRY